MPAQLYPRALYAGGVNWQRISAYYGRAVDWLPGMAAPAVNAAGEVTGVINAPGAGPGLPPAAAGFTGPLVVVVRNATDDASAQAAGYVTTPPAKPANYGG